MAPRAYWKGYLRLSLIFLSDFALPRDDRKREGQFPSNQQQSGKRIRYRKVDEGTGEEVPAEQIVKAYEVGKRPYIEITDEELEAIALESRRAIENDELYSIRPYYIAPDGKVGQDAFVVVRRVLEEMKMVAIALFGSG